MAPFGRIGFAIPAWTLVVCLLVTSPLCLALAETVSIDSVPSDSENSTPVESDGESSPLPVTRQSSLARQQRLVFFLTVPQRLSAFHPSRLIAPQMGISGRDVVLLFQRFLC